MEKQENQKISVKTEINAPADKVWKYWTEPKHITQWNFANSDWHSPAAKNDLKENGKFSYRMEAKDGSHGFDFEGVYNKVEPYKKISYTLSDGRKTHVYFSKKGNSTIIEETFDADKSHSAEMQRNGWQAILDNFKNYVERN
nr:SRPBCC family protein [Salinimicrobium terrae]